MRFSRTSFSLVKRTESAPRAGTVELDGSNTYELGET